MERDRDLECLKLAKHFYRAARLSEIASEGDNADFANLPAACNIARALRLTFGALLRSEGEIESQKIAVASLGSLYLALSDRGRSLLQFQVSREGRFDMFGEASALADELTAIEVVCNVTGDVKAVENGLSPERAGLLSALTALAIRFAEQEFGLS